MSNASVRKKTVSAWSKQLLKALPDHLASHEVLCRVAGRGDFVLHGSTTLGIEDAFSDLDIWLLLRPEDLTDLDSCSSTRFFEIEVAGKPGHINVESAEEFADRVERCDMDLIFQLRFAVPLLEDLGAARELMTRARQPMREEVRHTLFHFHYTEMRSEHRACDNPIERQDAVALLLSLPKAIAHALRAAMVLDSEPYPYDKWLSHASHRTPTGRELAPSVDRILEHLAAGQLHYPDGERTHPISLELRNMRRVLVDAARAAGFDHAWLTHWWLYLTEAAEGRRRLLW